MYVKVSERFDLRIYGNCEKSNFFYEIIPKLAHLELLDNVYNLNT